MGKLDEPEPVGLAENSRPGLLHLMRNHSPNHGEPEALLGVVDAYLRLNPQDDEVREARRRVAGRRPPARPLGLLLTSCWKACAFHSRTSTAGRRRSGHRRSSAALVKGFVTPNSGVPGMGAR